MTIIGGLFRSWLDLWSSFGVAVLANAPRYEDGPELSTASERALDEEERNFRILMAHWM